MLSGILGIVLLTALVFVELRHKQPILHFLLFKDRLFRTMNIIMFFAFSLWLGFLFVLPLFLQQLRGLSAFESGLTTAPQALGWIALSSIASKFYPKLGPKKMITIGLIGSVLITGSFIFIDTNTNLWILRILLFFRGSFMALAVIAVQAATFTNISSQETGRASSLFNTNRQVASSFGVAILGTILFQIFKSGPQTGSNQLFAFHLAFAAATVLGLIAIAFAFTIRNKDAAASLTPNTSAH